jgi:hypothetical protein
LYCLDFCRESSLLLNLSPSKNESSSSSNYP